MESKPLGEARFSLRWGLHQPAQLLALLAASHANASKCQRRPEAKRSLSLEMANLAAVVPAGPSCARLEDLLLLALAGAARPLASWDSNAVGWSGLFPRIDLEQHGQGQQRPAQENKSGGKVRIGTWIWGVVTHHRGPGLAASPLNSYPLAPDLTEISAPPWRSSGPGGPGRPRWQPICWPAAFRSAFHNRTRRGGFAAGCRRRPAPSAGKQLPAAADWLCLCLNDGAGRRGRAVRCRPAAALGLRPGATWIDFSTNIDPGRQPLAGQRLGRQAWPYLEAPVPVACGRGQSRQPACLVGRNRMARSGGPAPC